jgi:hypothetical protein
MDECKALGVGDAADEPQVDGARRLRILGGGGGGRYRGAQPDGGKRGRAVQVVARLSPW